MNKKISNGKEFVEHVFSLIPSPLKVGYQDVKIVEADLLDEAQGVYRAGQSEIRIKEGLEKVEVLNTILHEVLHAIAYNYGLNSEFKDDEHEEKIVNALGNGLTEVFIRNPKLVDFLRASV